MDLPPTTPSTQNHPRMRSSIACVRCRRSKIKCLNTGIDTTCEACSRSGRECIYPSPGAPSSHSAKREAGADGPQRVEAKRQRTKKAESQAVGAESVSAAGSATAGKERLGTMEEALDPDVLTPGLLQEVFELFQLHYSTDLPFLHGPTFLSPTVGAAVSLAAVMKSGSDAPTTSRKVHRVPGLEMLLLGLLALTARFHPGLIELHGSKDGGPPDPMTASEYYATVLRAALVGERGIYIGEPNLEIIQALLMIGLHEWGYVKGVKAWIHIGLAVRMAQAMGLQYEEGLDDVPWSLSTALRIEADHLGLKTGSTSSSDPNSSEAFIEDEARRRTFWSCFLMDRYLSSGKYRPAIIKIEEIRIQLPCSDKAFVFGERVCTNLIDGSCSRAGLRAKVKDQQASWRRQQSSNRIPFGQDRQDRNLNYQGDTQAEDDGDDKKGYTCEAGLSEGSCGRWMRLVDLWGKIARWSCAGGRKNEKYPPWDDRSTFSQLESELIKFRDTVPRSYRLSQSNTLAHLTQRTSSAYTLLHTLSLLCQIVLHRELMPFVPIRCRGPEGPLDEPTFHENDMPPNFWTNSARLVFQAARDIMDLVHACKSRGLLVETPILGFGLYSVAFIGIYALNFPHMDERGYMCRKTTESLNLLNGGEQATRNALEIIGHIRQRLPMAESWLRTLNRVHRYYKKILQDYARNTEALRMNRDILSLHNVERQLSLRESGLGGGQEGYNLIEKALKELGSIADEDVSSQNSPQRHVGPSSPLTSADTRAEQSKPQTSSSTGWTAVNSIASPEISGLGPQNVKHEATRGYSPERETLPRSYNILQGMHNHGANSAPPSTELPPLISPGANIHSTSPSVASASPHQGPGYYHSPLSHSNIASNDFRNYALQQQPSTLPQTQSGKSDRPASVQPPYPNQSLPSPQQQHAYAYSPSNYPALPMHPLPRVSTPTNDGGASYQAYSLPPMIHPGHPPSQQQQQQGSSGQSLSNISKITSATLATRQWDVATHEAWLNSLKTCLGGDDVAAFLDGRDWEYFQFRAREQGDVGTPNGGWLSEVWGGGS
ncbi:hypothetical protein MMC25_004962 [Agyrium rufum]|nr:hypothetical protein [Agyrium rufum]